MLDAHPSARGGVPRVRRDVVRHSRARAVWHGAQLHGRPLRREPRARRRGPLHRRARQPGRGAAHQGRRQPRRARRTSGWPSCRTGRSAPRTTAPSFCFPSGERQSPHELRAEARRTGRLRVRDPSPRPLVGWPEDVGTASAAVLRALLPHHCDRDRRGHTPHRRLRVRVRLADRPEPGVHPLRGRRSRGSRRGASAALSTSGSSPEPSNQAAHA